jgi:hypothetical protein
MASAGVPSSRVALLLALAWTATCTLAQQNGEIMFLSASGNKAGFRL